MLLVNCDRLNVLYLFQGLFEIFDGFCQFLNSSNLPETSQSSSIFTMRKDGKHFKTAYIEMVFLPSKAAFKG